MRLAGDKGVSGRLFLCMVRTFSALAVGLLVLLVALSLVAGRAYAYTVSDVTDVNGSSLLGREVDINLLSQGIAVHLPDRGDASVIVRITDDTGRLVSEIDFSRSSDETVWLTLPNPSPNSTYSLQLTFMGPGGSREVQSFALCTSGGNDGSAEDGEDGSGADTGGGQDENTPSPGASAGADTPDGSADASADNPAEGAADPAGSPADNSDASQADTDNEPSAAETTAPGEQSEARASVAPKVSAVQEGVVASAAARENRTSDAANEAESTAAGEADSAQGSSDALATMAAAPAAAGTTELTGKQLASMGTVFGLAGAKAGSADSDADSDAASAINLDITGLPYLWVLMWVLLLGALPAGLAWRAGRLQALKRLPTRFTS